MWAILTFIMILNILTLTLITYFLFKKSILFKQRIEKIALPYPSIDETVTSMNKKKIFMAYLSSAKYILRQLNILTNDSTKILARSLANAGWLSKNSIIVYLSIHFFSIMLFSLSSFGYVFFSTTAQQWSLLSRGITVIFMIWIGYRLPKLALSQMTKRYKIKLRRSILEFLDIFLICINAGFSNDKALKRVSMELAFIHPELCEQIKVLNTELNILPSRQLAWENLIERTGLSEISIVAQTINQSEQLGTSVAQALRTQVEMFRNERLNYVEQKALRLPTLLSLPLVLFIFPALLMVILGPAIIRATEFFHTMS